MALEGIVLLHGIFRTRLSMAGLAKFLQRHGYQTLNLDYPSTRHPLEQLAKHIHKDIASFASQCSTVHFIGYSMGGLVIRAYLHQFRPENLGRVVMLGTPNQGSRIADVVRNWWWYRKFYGPAGQQLITLQENFKSILGTVDYELGCIAGSRSLDPLGSLILGEPGDGKVSIESTKLKGMKDHCVIPIDHTFFPSSRKVWKETLHFLKKGCFSNDYKK